MEPRFSEDALARLDEETIAQNDFVQDDRNDSAFIPTRRAENQTYRLADLEASRKILQEKLTERLTEGTENKTDARIQAAMSKKLESLNNQIDRISGTANSRQNDTVDLALKQNSSNQGTESDEESREALHELKRARARALGGAKLAESNEGSPPAAEKQSVSEALASLDAVILPTEPENKTRKLTTSFRTLDSSLDEGVVTRSTATRSKPEAAPTVEAAPVVGGLFGTNEGNRDFTFAKKTKENPAQATAFPQTPATRILETPSDDGEKIAANEKEESNHWDFESTGRESDGLGTGGFGYRVSPDSTGQVDGGIITGGAIRGGEAKDKESSLAEVESKRSSAFFVAPEDQSVNAARPGSQPLALDENVRIAREWGIEEHSFRSDSEELQAKIPRKPSAPASPPGGAITANTALPETIPVPKFAVPVPSDDPGLGDDFGLGWAGKATENGRRLAEEETLRRQVAVKEADEKLVAGREADAKGDYKEARRWMERSASIKSDYYRAAYDQTRAEMLMEVDGEWESAVPSEESGEGGLSAGNGKNASLDEFHEMTGLTAEALTKGMDGGVADNLSALLPSERRREKSKGRDSRLQEGTDWFFGEEIQGVPVPKGFGLESEAARPQSESTGGARLSLRGATLNVPDRLAGEDDADPFSAVDESASEEVRSTTAKLRQIIIPELNLENTTLEEALEFIQLRTVELDSTTLDDGVRGVEFSVKNPPVVSDNDSDDLGGFGAPGDASATTIKKLNLKNVPANVALDYIAAAAKVRYKIEDDGKVTLIPLGGGEDDDIVQRSWKVPSEFGTFLSSSAELDGEVKADADPFTAGSDEETGGINPRKEITTLLKENGVSFSPNTSANFISESNTLIIRNTPTNLELIDGIVGAFRNEVVRKKAEEEKAQKEADALKRLRENFETATTEKSDSTFSLNVSDVSFKLAKAALAEGSWPDASKVRSEEFVNALDYDDTKPDQSEKIACVIEQGSHPFMQQRNLMRIAMSTASLGRNASTPLRLTILLDQSGSMERADRIESVKRAFALLSAQLNANDEISLVGFARTPRLLAERLKGNQAAKLAEIVANPLTEGGTNLEAALATGLEVSKQQYLKGAQNRVILLTDGAANLGDALPENLARQVESMRQHDIAFDACGVGADGLNDEILSSLAKQGDGRYYFLDRPEDADDGFAKQIAGALRPAAKNVKVQILFNPERVSKFKLYGFEKHKLKKEDFRNDSVDAAEMAAEESGVALYHFEPLPEGRGDIGTVSVRFLDTVTKQMVERTWAIPYQAEAALFSEAKPTLRLAGVAGLFAEKLKGSPVGERVELKRLRQETGLLKPTFNLQSRFHELSQMLQQAGQ
jgi:secreted protein with Ig-like and vWFA domain